MSVRKLSFRFYSKMKAATNFVAAENELLNSDIRITDPQLHDLINKERERQRKGLELIPSENYASLSVLQCLGSCLTNKYSEGLPGVRYYGGNEFIDEIEILCQKRALKAFGLDPSEWGVNVQPYSGSPANFAVYTALVGPQGKIMGLDLSDGGHLTHGFRSGDKKVSATSLYFESLAYNVNPETGLIDYDKLEESARSFKPKLIVAGVSCYSRCLDYERFRKICDENDSYLFADMSHVSGLIAAGVIPSPFEYADIVASTTHKTLRGPRAGVIFFRKGVKAETDTGEKILYDFENKINNAVFPGLQGGPHNNAIAAIATAMLQATTPEFKSYQKQVINNAKRLSEKLIELGFKITTGGTDVHLLLVDLKSFKISGAKAEYILELVGIACNKNTVPGDKSPLNPTGIRIGSPALTTRGMKEEHMDVVAEFLLKGVNLAKEVQVVSGPKLVDFKKCLKENEKFVEKVDSLKKEVEEFAENFFMPQEPFE